MRSNRAKATVHHFSPDSNTHLSLRFGATVATSSSIEKYRDDSSMCSRMGVDARATPNSPLFAINYSERWCALDTSYATAT